MPYEIDEAEDVSHLREEGLAHLRDNGVEDVETQSVIVDGEVVLGERHARNLPDMLKIGHAAYRLQQEALRRSGSNNPSGPKYSKKWDELAPPHLRSLESSERSNFIWMWENRERLQTWYQQLVKSEGHKWKWNNPKSVRTHFTKAQVALGEEPAAPARRRKSVNEERLDMQTRLDERARELEAALAHNVELETRIADFEHDLDDDQERVPFGEPNFWTAPVRDVVAYYYTRSYERVMEFIEDFQRYHQEELTREFEAGRQAGLAEGTDTPKPKRTRKAKPVTEPEPDHGEVIGTAVDVALDAAIVVKKPRAAKKKPAAKNTKLEAMGDQARQLKRDNPGWDAERIANKMRVSRSFVQDELDKEVA